jgi:DoxX-like protein
MKARMWLGWAVTGLMAALMLLPAVPDVLRIPGALAVFRHLGYPPYLLVFLGTAKILGVGVVLAPGVVRLKEWAFAGLTFDLTGALYSHLSVGRHINNVSGRAMELAVLCAPRIRGRRLRQSFGIAPCDRRGRDASRARPIASGRHETAQPRPD